ncbi:transcription elongation factor Spt5 [Ignisphaera sp. 4213-co]|uniref:Transcription elongation factor Spt5 n=1 Tax=Ignisphaera cupida TaxID=3050454 RepID=A0ABD4Z6K9_9CREN|nr:transcription elongation factor Spt5 [Ignisphaera sp. 4213-co]MDK6028530.1 transcription elongation factor Spt5 [Ignisphaera sp. 4213-co]
MLEKERQDKDIQKQESDVSITRQSTFFAVRTTAGQELNVLLMLEVRAKTLDLPIYSIVSLPNLKGYVVMETPGLHVVYEAIRGLKHVKGRASGTLKWEDLESLLKPKPLIDMLKEGEEVEIIAGPFRGMKARVVSVDKVKNEVSLNVLEASYPLTITVPVDYIRLAKRE